MQAQGAAEYGITTGAVGTLGTKVASALGGVTKPVTQTVQKGIPTPTPPNLDANRKAVAGKATKSGASTVSGVSTVQIDSTPSGASISVDNIVLAHTPANLTLPKGIHVIELSHDGYISWQKAILLTEGEKLSLNPALKDPKTSSPMFTVRR
jgi:hypothetical protein